MDGTYNVVEITKHYDSNGEEKTLDQSDYEDTLVYTNANGGKYMVKETTPPEGYEIQENWQWCIVVSPSVSWSSVKPNTILGGSTSESYIIGKSSASSDTAWHYVKAGSTAYYSHYATYDDTQNALFNYGTKLGNAVAVAINSGRVFHRERETFYHTARELLYEHAKEITQDAAHWMDFLDTAARVYRYSFPDIVLIHAQRPDASAVASYDIWSQTMHRYVKRGTKGIALIEDFRERPRLRYVYDISDTGILRGSKSPGYWQITDDMQDDMRDHLVETYDLDVERTPNLVSALIHISFDVYENHYQEITETVQDRMYQAARNGLPDYPAEMDVGSHVGMLLTNSMVYVLARRCGLNPLSVVSEEDFSQWLGGFQNFDLIDAVGQTVMEQSSQILHDIYKKTVELSNEKKKKTLDNTIKKSYITVNKNLTRDSTQGLDTSEKPTVLNLPADETVETGREYQNQNQGGQDHGDSVHSEGRISLSEPDGDGSTGRAGGDREVRRDAHEVSEGEPLRGIPQPAVPGSPEAALRRGRRAGMGETGISGTGTDETLQGSGTGSEQRLPGLRGMEEHDHEAVGGVHPEGISVHVVEVPEENKEESGQ